MDCNALLSEPPEPPLPSSQGSRASIGQSLSASKRLFGLLLSVQVHETLLHGAQAIGDEALNGLHDVSIEAVTLLRSELTSTLSKRECCS